MNDDPTISKLSFSLNTHHGDPDLYVSWVEKYPSKSGFERSSSRAGRFTDEVSFSHEDDGSIMRTFYIGVYAMSYSTFSVLVTAERSQ